MSSLARPMPLPPTTYRNQPFARVNTSFAGTAVICVILLITIFEGAARKWWFPDVPLLRYATYFSKDIFFLLLAYWSTRSQIVQNRKWLMWCACLILIPSAGSTLLHSNAAGIWLALRAYLVIPCCAFLAASLIRSFNDVERCALIIAFAAIPVAVVGFYQYSLPKDHALNRIDVGEEVMEGIERFGHVRASGTFMSVGSMGLMAGVTTWAGTFLVVPIARRRQWVCLVGLVALGAGFLCAATAMSRSGLVISCVIMVGSLLLYMRISQLLLGSLAAVAIVGFLLTMDPTEDAGDVELQDSVVTGLVGRVTQEGKFSERGTYVLTNLVLGVTKHPIGEGLGVGQNGSRYVSGTGGQPIESEWGRVALEVGPFGLLGVMGIRALAGLICWRALRTTVDVHRRLVIATALPYFAVMSLGKMAFNHVGNTFAWIVMTFALAAAAAVDRKSW